jgi:opacity protein-like surface antigen
MNKKMLIISCCAILLALTTTAYGAEESRYVKGNLGLGIVTDIDVINTNLPTSKGKVETQEGIAISGAMGYDFVGVRMEAELAYQYNDMDKATEGDIESLAFLGNVYWDLTTASPWSPFLGGGMGLALVNPNGHSGYLPNDHASVFAYHFSAGLSYEISKKAAFDLTYRYFATADPEFAGGIETDYSSQNLYAGIRYTY